MWWKSGSLPIVRAKVKVARSDALEMNEENGKPSQLIDLPA